MTFWRRWFGKRTDELETPYGPISRTKQELGKQQESTRPLTPEEEEYKDTCIAGAQGFAKECGITSEQLDADDLDVVLKYLAPSSPTEDEFEGIAEFVGFSFGEYLVRRYDMSWCVLTDSYGSDYAVRETSTKCTSFPLSVVAKRLQTGERDFLGPVAFAIQKQIQELRE